MSADVYLAKLLSDPLPLGNDLKILLLSFVASERRAMVATTAEREREIGTGGREEIAGTHSVDCQSRPIGRDGSVARPRPSVRPSVRDRAPIQTLEVDIKSCRFS